MTNNEKRLFSALCNYKSADFNDALTAHATPAVLGHLFFHRMAGIAYATLKKNEALGKVNREFRNSLKMAYEQNVTKNESFYHCVKLVNRVLSSVECPYAMLKGAVLCGYYPVGYRTSNDIDLLVHPSNVTEIGNALSSAGFRQGHIRNDSFIAATRKEIIESKMTRGETVPYILEVALPGMRYLEVDINFSLDYKNAPAQTLEEMLSKTALYPVHGASVKSLNFSDFFLHLCCHLYKEATTLPWVIMKRDMTLYKYCDIYMILADMTEEETEEVFRRAKECGMERECAFAILQTAALFDVINEKALAMANGIHVEDPEFLHTVVAPSEKKTYVYAEEDIRKRFFSDNRAELLHEVPGHV